MDQTGRVALVTGANKGIGFEVARALGRAGAAVLLGARRPEAGEAAAKALRDEGLRCQAIELDVTKPETIKAAAVAIDREFGVLDILVNNAAGGLNSVAPSQVELDQVREVFETNVFGVIAVTQAMLPLLKKSKAGRIVNVSSDFGSLTLNADPDMPHAQAITLAYPASKAALNGVSIAFAKELRGSGILLNLANPGFTDTDMTAGMGFKAGRSAAQGAEAIVRMATLDDDGPHGTFVDENGPVPW